VKRVKRTDKISLLKEPIELRSAHLLNYLALLSEPGGASQVTLLTRASPSSRELRAARLTRQNGKGNVQPTSPEFYAPLPLHPLKRDLFWLLDL
jgi:hypothetical protein